MKVISLLSASKSIFLVSKFAVPSTTKIPSSTVTGNENFNPVLSAIGMAVTVGIVTNDNKRSLLFIKGKVNR